MDFVLAVTDDLGFADGNYRITVRGGRAEVTRSVDASHAVVGVEELGSLYLGGVPARQFHIAGRLRADDITAARLGNSSAGCAAPIATPIFDPDGRMTS